MKDDEVRITVGDAMNNPTRPRIALGLPTRDEVKMDYCLSLMAMCVDMALFATFIPLNPRSCYVQANRNDIVNAARDERADWIMWVDGDIEAPQDGLRRLLTHQQPIVGATYARRSEPYGLMGETEEGVASVALEGLTEMKRIPAGFMLTSMEVFRKIKPPWFWVTLNEQTGKIDLGDDYYFCKKARDAGFKIYADGHLTSLIKHHGDIGIAPPKAVMPGVPR